MRKSLLGRLISFILGIVILAAIALAILFAFVKIRYDVNLYDTVKNVKKLNNSVKEEKICTNKFSNDDLTNAKNSINAVLPGFVTEKEDGSLDFNLDFTGGAVAIGASMSFTDKQMAAIINNLLEKTGGVSVEVAGESLDVELMEISISNIENSGKSADMKSVLKVDFKPVKEKLTGFPKKYLKKYVPDTLYISTTTTVTKNASLDIYDYKLSAKSIVLNAMSEKDSEQIIDALNKFVKFDNVDALNDKISSAFMKAIVGAKDGETTSKGFGASIGANTFGFSENAEKTEHYIVFERLVAPVGE